MFDMLLLFMILIGGYTALFYKLPPRGGHVLAGLSVLVIVVLWVLPAAYLIGNDPGKGNVGHGGPVWINYQGGSFSVNLPFTVGDIGNLGKACATLLMFGLLAGKLLGWKMRKS